MKNKTALKFIGTIITIILVIMVQRNIRIYYNIDSHIWFWVLFTLAVLATILICFLFQNEIKKIEEYFKRNSFLDFLIQIYMKHFEKHIKKMRKFIIYIKEKRMQIYDKYLKNHVPKMKNILNRIIENPIYMIIDLIIRVLVLGIILYKSIFPGYLDGKLIIHFILLILIIFIILSDYIELKLKEKKIKFRVNIYIIIFFIELTNFIG